MLCTPVCRDRDHCDQAHAGEEQAPVPGRLLLGGAVGGPCLAPSTSPLGHQQNAIEMFCDLSNVCIVFSAFGKGPLKGPKPLKSCPDAHISDRLMESNALCGVEGCLFKLQSRTFCCVVQTSPLSEKIHLYVMVQFYWWVLTRSFSLL